MTDSQPIAWLGNRVRLIDQTRLPQEEVYLELGTFKEVAQAIKEMKIRGAPAILPEWKPVERQDSEATLAYDSCRRPPDVDR